MLLMPLSKHVIGKLYLIRIFIINTNIADPYSWKHTQKCDNLIETGIINRILRGLQVINFKVTAIKFRN